MQAVNSGDVVPAAEQYAAVGSWHSTFMATLSISVDRLLGLTARTIGKPDQAMNHFEAGLVFCRASGFKPKVASTCYDYAETLIERNGAGDNAKARLLLEESLSIFTELGMRPLMESLQALHERASDQPVWASAYPDGLTQREVEVLGLVTAGKIDQEIAEELFISVNTVGNQWRSILSKTDSANRTEAAAYAIRRRLGPDEETAGE